ncbi:hypothetical protein SAMN04488543_1199 [Friedmanniella luteola]|uniref:4-amino-4-deoxy-L-arabinose transferase n=1 Tax=Friedmanniella luteola TaxID=546871 RepID=A0A1H1PYS1_9ACTN|nr:hypothetical protein [Friedmanniella luteola]SDS16372.1 hypothetical protein SAMN04488543_1199 [Friedmanniella luteola]
MPTSSGPGRAAPGPVVPAGFVVLGLLYPAVLGAVALAGSIGRVRQDFSDDAYYYALIAHHLVTGSGSTFGGLVPTNGYQPLWQLLLLPVAAVASGDRQLRLTFVLAGVLFSCFVVLAWKFADGLGARTEGLYAAGYATAVGGLFGNQVYNGMEFALVTPAAMLVVLLLLRSPEHLGQGRREAVRHGALLGLAGLVLVLSRLDAVALLLASGVVVLARRRDRDLRCAWLTTALVVVAGLVAYGAWNQVHFGTPVPVSGLAKALGGATPESAVSVFRSYLSFGDAGPLTSLWLGLQAVLVTAVALGLLRRTGGAAPLFSAPQDAALSGILQALALAQLLQLGYYAATSSWHLWEWYYYYVPLQFTVAGLVVLRAVLRARWSGVLSRPVVPVGAACLAAAVGVGLFVLDDPRTSWTTSSTGVGAWIDQHTAPDAVIAVGDRAGGLVWASRRRAVQLEGLVEDDRYLSVLRSRTIAQHLSEQSVDYYVRGDTLGDPAGATPLPGRPGCWSFVEPRQGQGPKSSVVACDGDLVHSAAQDDGSVWRVWIFRPELQVP